MNQISVLAILIALGVVFTSSSCGPAAPISDADACIELTGRQTTPLTLTNHIDHPDAPDYCIEAYT